MSKDKYLLVTEFISPYSEVGNEWVVDYCEVYEKAEDAEADAEAYTTDLFLDPNTKSRATIYELAGVLGKYPKPTRGSVVSLDARRKQR